MPAPDSQKLFPTDYCLQNLRHQVLYPCLEFSNGLVSYQLIKGRTIDSTIKATLDLSYRTSECAPSCILLQPRGARLRISVGVFSYRSPRQHVY